MKGLFSAWRKQKATKIRADVAEARIRELDGIPEHLHQDMIKALSTTTWWACQNFDLAWADCLDPPVKD
jgi:hypothetical protein